MIYYPPDVLELPVPVPEPAVLARLGYSRFRTKLDEAEMRRLKSGIAALARRARPRGCWTVIPVREITSSGIRLEDGHEIASAKVAARYPQARWMWFGAASIGPELPEYTAIAMQEKRTRDAVVADAVGSECADAAMDFLQKYAASALLRSGMRLDAFRFSPGYGDWALAGGQQLFFELLCMDRLGVTRHPESGIMQPEKTVTAAAGVVCG